MYMQKIYTLLLAAIAGCFISQHSFASDINAISQSEEEIVEAFKNQLRSQSAISDDFSFDIKNSFADCTRIRCLSNQEIRLQALSEFFYENPKINRATVVEEILRMKAKGMNLADELQVYSFARDIGLKNTAWEYSLYKKSQANAQTRKLGSKAAYTILSNQNKFSLPAWSSLSTRLRQTYQLPGVTAPVAKNVKLARDLINFKPDLKDYDNGHFVDAPKLFMFCRQDTSQACLLVLKDKNGNLVKRADGEYWHQPSLGFSSHNKKYNQISGDTPRGVYRLDGVMPDANRQIDFGKYRRLILNFVAKTPNEKDLKMLLPASSHTQNWWQETVVARELGRQSLRIHGTGRPAKQGTAHYPLLATSGCIAQRENTYSGVTYIDQRHLLDQLMIAQGLTAVYANETKISTLLYVFNLDNKKKPMTLADLKAAKIL
jgi:hypothetical protein